MKNHTPYRVEVNIGQRYPLSIDCDTHQDALKRARQYSGVGLARIHKCTATSSTDRLREFLLQKKFRRGAIDQVMTAAKKAGLL